jgi:hypothetical protein
MGTGDGGQTKKFPIVLVVHSSLSFGLFLPTSFISPIDRLTTGAYLKPLQYPMIASEP